MTDNTPKPLVWIVGRRNPTAAQRATLARHLSLDEVQVKNVNLHLPDREEELAEIVEPYLWHGTPGARPLLVGTFPTRHVLALLNLGIAVGWFENDTAATFNGVFPCTGLRVCRIGPGGRILTRRTPCPVSLDEQKGGAR